MLVSSRGSSAHHHHHHHRRQTRWQRLVFVLVLLVLLQAAVATNSSLERRNNDSGDDNETTTIHPRLVLHEEGEGVLYENLGPATQQGISTTTTTTTASANGAATTIGGSTNKEDVNVMILPDGRLAPVDTSPTRSRGSSSSRPMDFDPVLDRDPLYSDARRRMGRKSSSSSKLQRDLSGVLQRHHKRFGNRHRFGKPKGTHRNGKQGGKGGKSGGKGSSSSSNDTADEGKGKGKGGNCSKSSSGKGKGKGYRRSRFRERGKGDNSSTSGSGSGSSKSGKGECDDDDDEDDDADIESPTASPSPTAELSMSPTGGPTECPINEVVRWVLVDTDLVFPNSEIRDFSPPEDTLVLEDVMAENLSIIVEVADPGDCTESVLFDADFIPGNQDRIENTVPYSLGSDNPNTGVINPVPELSQPGTYTIEATPFSENGASGDMGTTATLTLTVVVSASLQTG